MAESKSESKEEGKDDFTLIDKVQEFCVSSELEKTFESFMREHAHSFMNLVESKDGDEHSLEYYDIYRKYLAVFEKKIEDFLEKEGYSTAQFYSECRKIIEGDDVFGSRRFFIEVLLASSEYENFMMLMKSEVRSMQRK